jgi:hypothetical protein
MKLLRVVFLSSLASLLVLGIAGALCPSRSVAAAEPTAGGKTALATASDDGALFTAFVPVLRHPRCMNCHSQGDYPRQGDDGHPHAMDVRRGPDGHGVTAEKCSTCHQDHNLAGAHLPPGAPNWGLPPASTPMIWQGLTDAQICESIKDRKKNRDRNLDQLVEHLTADKLVMWAWEPGEGRTPVPMPHDEFSAKVKQWQAAGAPCPAR